ncbi:MAG: CorA family divalent cation transporter [Patescibacteria group bacterium]
MLTRYAHSGLTWIDLEAPTVEEAEAVVKEFNLDQSYVGEIMSPTLKPRLDVYAQYLYLVLHFPAYRHMHGFVADHEVDIVVGKSFLITVHYEVVTAIRDFAAAFEAAVLMKRKGALHAGHVVLELTRYLYRGVESELDAIEESVTDIERAIFRGRERDMVLPISTTMRELLHHKRLLASQDDELKELEQVGASLFGSTDKTHLAQIPTLHYRVYARALMLVETLSELRATNDSLLSTKQNEITKNLTIVASIMLPLSLIAGVFGMNTEHTPIVGHPLDFFIIVAILVALGFLFLFYFILKRWF